jgi:hypothetical protein
MAIRLGFQVALGSAPFDKSEALRLLKLPKLKLTVLVGEQWPFL